MEEAKRRGALYQSSAGSFWCFRSSQGRAQAQSRFSAEQGATHRAAVRLCVWGVPAFLWVGLVCCGWDGTQLTLLAADSGTLGCGICWGISSVLLRPWRDAHTSIPWLQWANRSSPERLHSLLLPLHTPTAAVTRHDKQVWQAPLYSPVWEEPIKVCGALNATWWTLEWKIFFI